ncbi:protein THEMIS2 isoform X1 [Electrophorus electricus]|uniref:protein THEMIS2 isoform X1 n=1 Tax=Electrophorus electricus TaxID=8005 RepID=UPI0015D0634B|nr:protein THEMIS2 isoform X1 [Electrophorus electricus]
MEDIKEALSLQEFTTNLDMSLLPRILQICSGVYFQGSVYELSGSEVCLSTGDLVKIIGVELLSVCCDEIGANSTFELPLNHSGLFKLVPEGLPYSSIEEMVGLQPVGLDACGSFTFVSRNQLIIDNFTVPAGSEITILSVEHSEDKESYSRCKLTGQQGVSAEVHIPLSCHGEFYECENDHGYSLQEIMLSARLRSRRFRNTKSKKCGSPLFFSPIYQIQGIMHMRKDIVKFPSSLEVDVIDVTEQCKDLTFVIPISIAEVPNQPKETFPIMAEILETPETSRFFCSHWFEQLQKGKNIVLHRWDKTPMLIACTPKGRKAQRYFLLSHVYGGQMRRKAREFTSVFELYRASTHLPSLTVSVTRNCEAIEEEGVPALSVGEQLEVLRLQAMEVPGNKLEAVSNMDCLICRRILEEDENDDEDLEDQAQEGEICLPLFTPAHFVEKLPDKKKYCLAELGQHSQLPLEIKVVSRDRVLEKDPLVELPALRLEDAIEETTVLASLSEHPEQCFELPIRWLQMSLSLISDPLPWHNSQPPEFYIEAVTEITDHLYHEYHKFMQRDEAPPPRPPKRKSLIPKTEKGPKEAMPVTKSNTLPAQLATLSLEQIKPILRRRSPPPPPLGPDKTESSPPVVPRKSITENLSKPNTYVMTPHMQKKEQTENISSDSEHDYETLEDIINDAHDCIMFY